MPIYEYACSQCKNEFELIVRKSDEKVMCPKCASGKVTKKFSVFASKSNGGDSGSLPACTSNPTSCGRCGTGVPHSH